MPTDYQVGVEPDVEVRAEIARGDWQRALARLRAIEQHRDLTPGELELLAEVAYGAGELEAAIGAWERLHAQALTAGERVLAARAATSVAMYLMMDSGLMAPVRAWANRAQRLLADEDEGPVHAWLAMTFTYERLLSGDLAQAGQWAETAIAIGDRRDAPSPATLARIARARLKILAGQVEEGLGLLDDAAVTIMSGTIDPLVVGMAFCELICAMQGLAQYDRAEQWTDAMERWRHHHAVGGINGRCRVHRAEILRLRGTCEAAEAEALHACAELRPWMRREFGWPLTELGTIRLRRGDLAGAEEALLEAYTHGWDPQPGLALLRLAQGEVQRAVAVIDDALERPVNAPSKERPPHTGLRRAPLLEAQVEISLADDDPGTARRAAAELRDIARQFHSRALTASATLAQARVALAEDAPEAAVADASTAVETWCEIGAPYEAATARLVVSEALVRCGRVQAVHAEHRAAKRAFEAMGAKPIAPPVAVTLAVGTARDGGVGATSTDEAMVFRAEGDTRTIRFDGTTVLLRDLKGMRYLAQLLREPGREFHVLDLTSRETGQPAESRPPDTESLTARTADDTGPIIDDEARQAYQRRLHEIEDDIDEATRNGDVDRIALATADRDYLVTELSRAVGLGGRSRTTGSTSERARAAVTRAVRYAMDRIAEHHPGLADHLEHSIRTGTYCSYDPDPRHPPRWQT